MRDQYVGDISDVIKFAFLRALLGSDSQLKLGIAWYYVPGDDGRADGRHVEWRNDTAWQQLDPIVHRELSSLPVRSITALEEAAIWPDGVRFHREPVPPALQRDAWSAIKRTALDGANIVFLDPDNGLCEADEETAKHVSLSELRALRQRGRTLVFISFPKRKRYEEQILDLHERIKRGTDADSVVTLRTNVSLPRAPGSRFFVPRPRWFTVIDGDRALFQRIEAFAEALRGLPRVRAVVMPN